MAGDNIYEGPATAEDYRLKFEEPYKALLDDGVKFFAALGNHDDPNQIYYKPFNMDGHRYYTFVPPVDPITRWDTRVRFFALDSTYLDREQMQWFEQERPIDARSGRSRFCIIRSIRRDAIRCRARGIRFALESAFVNRRRRRGVLGTRAHLRAVGTAERDPVLHHRRRRLSARRRREAVASDREELRPATTTSCWRKSTDEGFSFRRSTGTARRSTRGRCGGRPPTEAPHLLRTRRPSVICSPFA